MTKSWHDAAKMIRAPLLLMLLLAGCEGGKSDAELAKLDHVLAAGADPAVTAALEDPIMTDRDLSVADDSRRVRLVTGPVQALYPPRTKINAPLSSALDGLKRAPACELGFAQGASWATRLPPAFRVYPGARLIEAAGNDRPGCRSRVVAFHAAVPPQAVLDWYRARALAGGYTADVQRRGADRILGGTRARDGARYYLIVSPRATASEASLIATGG